MKLFSRKKSTSDAVHTPRLYAYSDRGDYRAENQDAVVCRQLSKPTQIGDTVMRTIRSGGENRKIPVPAYPERDTVLCAVCDGIGGLERGDLASGIVAAAMERFSDDIAAWPESNAADNDNAEILFSHFKDAVEQANETLYETAQQYGLHCGTTFSGVLAVGRRYLILHVGDSRIYRFRPYDAPGLRLVSLTEDECVWKKTEKNGQSVMRSYLENFVGRDRTLSFRSYHGTFAAGDLLLCVTDGYYHNLTEEDVLDLYRRLARNDNEALHDTARAMIKRGERDNVSAVAYLWGEPLDEKYWNVPTPTDLPDDEDKTIL